MISLYNNDKYRPPFRRGHKREFADPTIEIDLIPLRLNHRFSIGTMIGKKSYERGMDKGWGTIESRRRSNPSACCLLPLSNHSLGGGRRGWSRFCKIPTAARTRVENALAAASLRFSPFQLSNWKWRRTLDPTPQPLTYPSPPFRVPSSPWFPLVTRERRMADHHRM